MNKWVVLYKKQHRITKTLEEASALADSFLSRDNKCSTEIIRLEDYLKREDRKRKRGKRSK